MAEDLVPDTASRGSSLVRRTVHALAVALARRDGRVAFGGSLVGYFLLYSYAVGNLGPGRGTYGISVVADPLALLWMRRGPFSYEPIATIQLGPVDYLFAPISAAVGFTVAVLVAANVTVSIAAWRSPSSCGIDESVGALAGVPALLSGMACCGPAILVVVGIQATAGLLAVFQWLLPAAVVLLLATLLYVGRQVDPAVLAAGNRR